MIHPSSIETIVFLNVRLRIKGFRITQTTPIGDLQTPGIEDPDQYAEI